MYAAAKGFRPLTSCNFLFINVVFHRACASDVSCAAIFQTRITFINNICAHCRKYLIGKSLNGTLARSQRYTLSLWVHLRKVTRRFSMGWNPRALILITIQWLDLKFIGKQFEAEVGALLLGDFSEDSRMCETNHDFAKEKVARLPLPFP